jgi:putative PIG3 family NAD(P)H quinone oxidoreductase
MRAVVLREHGGTEVLRIEDVSDPEPGPEEALVAVRASAVNRADLLQRMGLYPGPPAELEIPGLELSGTVIGIGERVRSVGVGDQVMSIVGGGGYAERAVVHERQLMPVPEGVALADAAAIPEVYLTAWDALVVQGGFTSGRVVLVHAGASGVGTAAIQLVKALGGSVAVTCSARKAEACTALGADWVFERSPHAWLDDAKAAVPQGFDVVLDVIGADELNRNLEVVAPKGTIMQVGLMGGGDAPMQMGLLLGKRVRLIGTVLRARPLEEKATLSQRFTREVVPLFERGAVAPVIDRRYPLEEVALAHDHVGADANVGKVVLDVHG